MAILSVVEKELSTVYIFAFRMRRSAFSVVQDVMLFINIIMAGIRVRIFMNDIGIDDITNLKKLCVCHYAFLKMR
jgi:hypothetical protein